MSLQSEIRIEQAEIFRVDPETFSVSVVTKFSKAVFHSVQWTTPYVHFYKGEGSYGMPEVGARCLVAYSVPKDIRQDVFELPPMIIGFYTPSRFMEWGADQSGPDGGEVDLTPFNSETLIDGEKIITDGRISYRNKREKLIPGDYVCGKTPSGNKIILYTGGVTQVTANNLCQRLYISKDNWIRDFCQNYLLSCDGGYTRWRDEIGGTSQSPELRTTLENHIRSDTLDYEVKRSGERVEEQKDFRKHKVINTWQGHRGDISLISVVGPKDLELDEYPFNESFRRAKGVYPTFFRGDGAANPNYYVAPYRLDLIAPGKRGIRENDNTEEIPDGNPVLGIHIQGGGGAEGQPKAFWGTLNIVNRNDIYVTSEGSGYFFFDKDVNMTVNESLRMSIGHSDKEGPFDQWHRVIIHAEKDGPDGRLYIWAKGLHDQSEFGDERPQAFDLRVGRGHIYNKVVTQGDIHQEIGGCGDILRTTYHGKIMDQVVGEGYEGLMISHQVSQGSIFNQVINQGSIFNKTSIGHIHSMVGEGNIIDEVNVSGTILHHNRFGLIQSQVDMGEINQLCSGGFIKQEVGMGMISRKATVGLISDSVGFGTIESSVDAGLINISAKAGIVNIYGILVFIGCLPMPAVGPPVARVSKLPVDPVPDVTPIPKIPYLEETK